MPLRDGGPVLSAEAVESLSQTGGSDGSDPARDTTTSCSSSGRTTIADRSTIAARSTIADSRRGTIGGRDESVRRKTVSIAGGDEMDRAAMVSITENRRERP